MIGERAQVVSHPTLSWGLLLLILCDVSRSTNGDPLPPGSGPLLVTLPQGPKVSLYQNKAFALTCKGKNGDPALFTDLKWFDPRGNEIVSTMDRTISAFGENLMLTFMNPTNNDGGLYKCRGKYQNTDSMEVDVELFVYKDITWDNCPSVQALVKGRQGDVIRCGVDSQPPAAISWYKDNSPLDVQRYHMEQKGVTIRGTSREEDAGDYKVRAVVSETGRVMYKDVKVEIHEKPQISDGLPEEFEVIEEEEATLRCQAKARPHAFYSWLDPQKRNLSSAYGYRVDRVEGYLTIAKVQDKDRGDFSCIAENAAGADEKTTSLKIITKPHISSFDNITAEEGTGTKFECKASGNPLPQLSIRKDGDSQTFIAGERILLDEARSGDGRETILSLKMANVQRSDGSLYYCVAQNKAAKVERAGHLQVEFKPDMSATSTMFKTWDSHSVNITCISNAVPNATISWYGLRGELLDGDGITYKVTSDFGRSHLRVTPRQGHGNVYGTYRCKAVNRYGQSEVDISLKEAFKPERTPDMEQIKSTPYAFTIRYKGPEEEGGLPLTMFHVDYTEENMYDNKKAVMPASAGPVFIVENLKPNTNYKMRFALENGAGLGPFGNEYSWRTPGESAPDWPQYIIDDPSRDPLSGDVLSRFSQEYLVRWIEPAANGAAIDSYEIKYYMVGKDGHNEWEKVGDTLKEAVTPGDLLNYKITRLRPSSYYRVELTAHNSLGYSDPRLLVFKTADGPEIVELPGSNAPSSIPGTESSFTPVIWIMLIVICILLLIMDVTLCFRFDMGFLHCIYSSTCLSHANASQEKKVNKSEGEGGGDGDVTNQNVQKEQEPVTPEPAGSELDNPVLDNRADEPTAAAPMQPKAQLPKDSAV